MTYSEFIESIKQKYGGQDFHLLASGPTLIRFDYSLLDNLNVITINHSYKMIKSLFTVSVDEEFVRKEDSKAPYNTKLVMYKLKDDSGHSKFPGIHWKNSEEFSMNPGDGVYRYKNSGIAAVTIALHAGARRIFLYGYDYRFIDRVAHATEGQFNHRIFWNPKQTDKKNTEDEIKSLHNRVELFSVFPRDRIFNLSPVSKIPYFPKISIQQMKKMCGIDLIR